MTRELHRVDSQTEISLQYPGVKLERVSSSPSPISGGPKTATPQHIKRFWAAVCCACALSASLPASADVYQFIAEDGTPHFSDLPTDSRFRLLLRTEEKVQGATGAKPQRHRPGVVKRRFEVEISAAALANRIDAELLHAVIETESAYNSKAVSPKGALGLMQLMPATARRYGVADPLDAAQNVRGGAQHLRDLLDLFSDNKELALAAYNAGTGAVMAHGRRIPPYAETIRYVPAVLENYQLLRGNKPAAGK